MKLTIYLNTCLEQPERIVTVNAEPVEIDPRMQTCIHRTPFDPYMKKYWAVSEVTTGYRCGRKAKTKEEAISNAAVKIKSASDETIRNGMAEALNHTSNLGEYLAFEAKP